MITTPEQDIAQLVEKINDSFEYWDKVKYKIIPAGYTPVQLWTYVKASRFKSKIEIWQRYGIILSLTNKMQRQCHELDVKFGSFWENVIVATDDKKERYLTSSIMEEAISSSQMEGAETTREVAKDILRKNKLPKDKSQRMIVNNYHTIQFIVENRSKPLTEKLFLQVHKLMTQNTLQNSEDEGRFRLNDDVVVEDGITHEVVHRPPSFKEIPEFIEQLCSFFNKSNSPLFIHPIIRGIIIHFMIAYFHPFADGNGRTARALFYWYMLKQGYRFTEYLSISRIIAKTKKAYEKSFLYTEADENDIGYFVVYNLSILEKSFTELRQYLLKKQSEKEAAGAYLHLGGINFRQAQIIKMFIDNPKVLITIKDLQIKFSVTPTTAKTDILGLMSRGFIEEISLNRVKKAYRKSDVFDKLINSDDE